MAIIDEILKRVQENQQDNATRQNPFSSGEKVHETKAWRDWKGAVNVSDLETGKTRRKYYGPASEKRASKDSFGTDIGQAMASSIQGEESHLKSALGTIGLGIGGLIHGDNNWQPEVGSALWKLTEGAEADSGAASKFQEDAEFGRSELGKRVMQLTNAGTSFALQRALDAALPGLGTAEMYMSAGGSSAEDARQRGLSISTQLLKGVKTGAMAWATENLSKISGLKGASGEGLIDGLIDNASVRIADKGGSVALFRFLTGAASEGAEEVLEDYFNYWGDKFIAGVTKGDYDIEELPDAIEIAWDGIIGAALGALGGVDTVAKVNSGKATADALGMSYGDYLLANMESGRQAFDEEKQSKKAARKEKLGAIKGLVGEANAYVQNIFKDADSAIKAKKAAEQGQQMPVAGQQQSAQQVTPEAAETPEMTPSREFNSKPEAETQFPPQAPLANPAQQENSRVTNPQVDAKVESQPETASIEAVQPQEGQKDGGTDYNNQQAGRDAVSDKGRPNEAVSPSDNQTFGDGGAVVGREADTGEDNKRFAEKIKKASGKAEKLSQSIEKHSKGTSNVVRAKILDERITEVGAHGDLMEAIKGMDDKAATALSLDYIIGEMADNDRAGLAQVLRDSGMDEATSKQILEEALGKEEVPFTLSEEETKPLEADKREQPAKNQKPPSKASTKIEVGKLEVSEENGKRVATVKDTDGKKAHIGGDVDTVRVAHKYTRKRGDRNIPGLNGMKIIQHGNTDSYTVVDKKGLVVGNYTSLSAARQATGSKGGSYNMAKFSLGDNVVDYGQGYIEVDTDTAFTNADYLTTQNRSLASDDLEILYSRHGKAGYTGNTTTDVVLIELSKEHFLDSAKEKGSKYGKYSEKFLEKKWYDGFHALLYGIKDDYGNYIKVPGFYGKNGKHYVFAGWSASKSRKGVGIFMEEGKYKKFRHRMTGGLKPSEIKEFNPAKYLTSQGTYWTPSNPDTGVKCKDLIVMADIKNIMHNVTRMFIRSSDLDSDVEALIKAGYTKEAAEAKLKSVKAGEAFLLTGDLITKCTDGMGFIDSEALKGHDFQARGVGGLKGFLLNCDFKSLYGDNIPVMGDQAFTIFDPETGEVVGGIRHRDEETGVEILNKWGKWQKVKDAKGIVFESMVKFAGEYSVYKEVDGKQVIDPDASTQNFIDAMGDTDLRSIPIENVFGRSWNEDDDEDTGSHPGYRRRNLGQLTRGLDGVSPDTAAQLLKEGFEEPVKEMMSTKEGMLRALGVNPETLEMPTNGSTIAYMAAADPDGFLNSTLGKKAVYDEIMRIAGDARGGRLLLKDSDQAYQYISPDPFGLINLMTQYTTQMQDALLGSTAKGKASDNPLFDYALKGNREVKNKHTGERYIGDIYSSKLGKGETMVGRLPSNEMTDVQLRRNNRQKVYEQMLEKYGFGNTAAFFAINDTLALNLDNDYDGDTSFLFQHALADAIKEAHKKLGKLRDGKGNLVRGSELFTERGSSKAQKKGTDADDFIIGAVKLALDSPSIGLVDDFINVTDELPTSWFSNLAKEQNMTPEAFKRMLVARLAAAYKASYDYAKDGKFDPDFAQSVTDTEKLICKLLEEHGYYVDAKGLDEKEYKDRYVAFLPALARYEFSPNIKKRERVAKAMAKANDAKVKGKKTVIEPGESLLSSFYKDNTLSKISPTKYKESEASYKEKADVLKELFPWENREDTYDFRTLSTIAPAAYQSVDPDVMFKLGLFYYKVVNQAGKGKGENSAEAMRDTLKSLYDAAGLDSTQFSSLMSMALYYNADDFRYNSVNVFLNFDQNDGTTPVHEVFKRKFRIESSISKLEASVKKLAQERHDVVQPYLKAKEYYENLKTTQASELDLKRQLQNEMAKLNEEITWLNERINFANDTFKTEGKRNEFAAKLMEQEDALSMFKKQMEDMQSRLDALEKEVASKAFLTDEAKKKISELNRPIRDAHKAMMSMVDSTLDAVNALNEAYNEATSKLEGEQAKKWLYGIGYVGDTGIETERAQKDLIRKLDLLLLSNGYEMQDVLLDPAVKVLLDSGAVDWVKTKPDTSATINGEAQGTVYYVEPEHVSDIKKFLASYKGERVYEKLGFTMPASVMEEPTSVPNSTFQSPPPSGEPTTSQYKEGVRKTSDTTKAKEEPAQPKAEEPIKKKAKQEAKPEEQEFPKAKPEPVPRETTYGIRFKRVSEALGRIANGFGDGAQTIVPDSTKDFLGEAFGQARHDLYEFGKDLVNAFNAEDDGVTLRAFSKELPERVKNTAALQSLLGDAEISMAAKIAKRLADSANAKNPLVFQTAAAEFAEVMAKEVEELPKTLDKLAKMSKAIEKAGPLAKFLASTQIGSRIASTYIGYQRNFSNIMMGLDNFDKFAKGPGYELVNQLESSLFDATTLLGNATVHNMSAREAFDKSEASKKTVTLDVIKKGQKESHTISMAEAVDFLHTIKTLEESKINAWDKISYYIGENDSLRINNEGQFKNVKEALEKAVFGDKDVRAFYDSFTEGYDMYAEPSQQAIAKASGRNVEMFLKGKYYPLWSFVEKTASPGSKGFDYGMDDILYTKSRIQYEGGAIRILDPTERFNTYTALADKVVANSEFGAAIDRLNRKGIGDNLEKLVEKRYGKGHTDIVKQTVKNANDFRAETDEVSSLLRSIRLNVQTGALFGNLGSMLKQYPSVFNAVGVVDMDDILYGIGAIFNKEERAKASQLGAIKNRYLGPYDPDVHDAFEGQTAFNKFFDKISEKAPWLKFFSDGFQRIDSEAIKTIYLAARHNVMKEGLTEADKGFEQKVLDKFKTAFLRTQPQFNKLLRPYVQSTDNEIVRMFGMFKTQPLQNFNTMIRAVNEYNTVKEKYGTDSEQFKEVSKQMTGVIAGQATASLMFGALGALAKLLYHRRKDLEDKDGNLDAGKLMARVLMNAAEASGGMMVFGDSAVQFVIDRLSGGSTKEFYGLSAGAISSVVDAVDAISGFAENPSRYNAKKAAGYIATLFGVPLNNAYSILNSFIMYGKDIAGGNEGNYDDILRYLDAEAKAAKKEEEKAAKETAKAAEKSGADMLADTAKKNTSQSELNSTGEQKASEVGRYLTKPYTALVEAGMSPQSSKDFLGEIDADGNNSVKQAEMIAYYKAHPEDEQYVAAMWNSYGYKTSWEKAKKKAG